MNRSRRSAPVASAFLTVGLAHHTPAGRAGVAIAIQNSRGELLTSWYVVSQDNAENIQAEAAALEPHWTAPHHGREWLHERLRGIVDRCRL